MSEFDADTAVDAVAAGSYAATVTDRWNGFGNRPNGGYLLATCMRALQRDLTLPDPLAVSAFFLRPAAAGPALIRTETVRTGRRIATGEARLVQEDREIIRAVASFTDLSRATGRTLMLEGMPDLPPPDETDAAYPAVIEIGEPVSTTLQLTVHVRARPSPGWLACRVSTRYVTGGFHEEDFEIWGADGTLVAQSRQLALLA